MRNQSDYLLKGLGVAVLGLGLALTACGDDDDDSSTPTATQPQATPTATAVQATPTPTAVPTPTATATAVPTGPGLAIIAPARDGTNRALGTDPDLSVAITIAATGFTLADPSDTSETGCNGQDNCGHVHIFIDGTDGNQGSLPYNNLGWTPQVNALFKYVTPPTGEHTITVQLVHNDHTPVLVGGNPVEDSVVVNTTIAVPAVTIAIPDGSTVQATNNDSLDVLVNFAAPNATLVETSAECNGVDFCGKIFGYVDGTKIAESITSPIVLPFDQVNSPGGEHNITLKLVNHSGVVYTFDNPVDDPDEGPQEVADSVDVTVELPAPQLIAALGDGQRVRLGDDNLNTLTITYALQDFTVGTAAVCDESEVPCGQVLVNLDGDDGNGPGISYNNFSENTTNIQAYFSYLGSGDAKYGAHTIDLSVVDHDGNALNGLDGQITDSAEVFAISQTDPNLVISTPVSGNEVTPDASGAIQVTFRVTPVSFQIAAQDACNVNATDCGYVKVSVNGSVKEAQAVASPVTVDVSGITGEAAIKVELYSWANGKQAWPYDGGVDVAETSTVTIVPAN